MQKTLDHVIGMAWKSSLVLNLAMRNIVNYVSKFNATCNYIFVA